MVDGARLRDYGNSSFNTTLLSLVTATLFETLHSRRALDRLDAADVDGSGGVPEIVFGLHLEPDAGAVAEELARAEWRWPG